MDHTPRTLDDQTFVLGLEENGLDSLAHAIEHYLDGARPSYLKYSILHTFHAVDLMLKAHLARINQFLFYQDPAGPITEDSNTLYFDKTVKELAKHGISLSADDRRDLLTLKKYRNRIEHRQISADRDELDKWLGQAMRFLDRFLKAELQLDLRNHLDARTYDTLISLLHGFEEAVARACRELEAHVGPDWDGIADAEAIECANCCSAMVPYPDPRCEPGRAQCCMPKCREMLFVTSCDICETGMSSLTGFERGEPNYCESCIEYHLGD